MSSRVKRTPGSRARNGLPSPPPRPATASAKPACTGRPPADRPLMGMRLRAHESERRAWTAAAALAGKELGTWIAESLNAAAAATIVAATDRAPGGAPEGGGES